MTKMTPWYDAATTCPDKVGVYQIGVGDGFIIGYSAWRSGKWHSVQSSPRWASWTKYETTIMRHNSGAQWRGFTEKQDA